MTRFVRYAQMGLTLTALALLASAPGLTAEVNVRVPTPEIHVPTPHVHVRTPEVHVRTRDVHRRTPEAHVRTRDIYRRKSGPPTPWQQPTTWQQFELYPYSGVNFAGYSCRGLALGDILFTIVSMSPSNQALTDTFTGTMGGLGPNRPLQGTISQNADGSYSITFTLNDGPDTFTYTGTLTPQPGGGWSMSVSVTMNGQPDGTRSCVLSS